jgi:ABC-type branched-subunit amino acid transport system substrate-binding protein
MPKLLALLFALLPAVSSADAKPDILLGQVVSITSPLVGEISSKLKIGYEAYINRINAQGGIDGRKIRLIQKEDGYQAEKTLALTRELVDIDKVVALVGYLGTPGPSRIIKENLLVSNDIALIGPSTGIAKVLAESNVFPVRATYESELAEVASHIKTMQLKRVALLSWNAGSGPILAAAFPGIAKNTGLEQVYTKSFDVPADKSALTHSLDDAVLPLQKLRPEAVLLIAGGIPLYEAVKKLRSTLPASTPIYTVSVVNWEDLVRNVGTKLAQGVMISQSVPYPYSPRLPIVRDYMEDMRKAAVTPDYYSLEGYLGAVITVEALKRASPDLTRSNITRVLNKLGKVEISGFQVNYTPTRRQGFLTPEMTMITSQGTLLR